MVVGNGFIASALSQFKSSKDVIIFASGVSNSREHRPEPFKREEKLLKSFTVERKLLVYFSTTSVFDESLQSSTYVKHKLRMEELVRTSAGDHVIFRLPIMIGQSSNPNTLINFLIDNISSGKPFFAHKNACRYLLTIGDLQSFVPAFIESEGFRNKTHNLYSSKQIQVTELIRELEIITGKVAQFQLVDEGDCYQVMLSEDVRNHPLFRFRPLHDILLESFV